MNLTAELIEALHAEEDLYMNTGKELQDAVLAALKKEFPVPATHGVSPYRFSLDGGGRDLIQDALVSSDVRIFVELGCFLCGSVEQWLAHKSDLTVIGIDPWVGRWHEILERYLPNPTFNNCFKFIPDRLAFVESVRTHGPFLSAMANMQPYADRFVPIKGKSPELLYLLKEKGLQPDFVYFDNDKGLVDLDVALELFPHAQLGGDDWTWGKDQGYPTQLAVKAFCERTGFSYEARKATWIIRKS